MESAWRALSPPRAVSTAEAELIRALAEWSGVAQLVAQADSARVVGECECGCPSVRLTVDGPAVPSQTVAALSDLDREDYFSIWATADPDQGAVEVVLHVVAGRMEELEIFAGDQGAVPLIPPPGQLRNLMTQ